MHSALEEVRLRVSKSTEATKKSNLGQFLTPGRTAAFMAGLFPPASGNCRLLDAGAGAGIGSLAGAFLERCVSEALPRNDIQVTAFELDDSLHADLNHGLLGYADRLASTGSGLDSYRQKNPERRWGRTSRGQARLISALDGILDQSRLTH